MIESQSFLEYWQNRWIRVRGNIFNLSWEILLVLFVAPLPFCYLSFSLSLSMGLNILENFIFSGSLVSNTSYTSLYYPGNWQNWEGSRAEGLESVGKGRGAGANENNWVWFGVNDFIWVSSLISSPSPLPSYYSGLARKHESQRVTLILIFTHRCLCRLRLNVELI